MGFDALGKGEGNENSPRVPAARVLSSGFVRKPNLATSNVVVMSSASPSAVQPATVQALSIRAEAQGALALAEGTVVATQVRQELAVSLELGAMLANNRRAEARMKGYEGESCSECGQLHHGAQRHLLSASTSGSSAAGCS